MISVRGELGDGDIQDKNSENREVAFDAVSTHLDDSASAVPEGKGSSGCREAGARSR